jgi:dienelactone hydrolase
VALARIRPGVDGVRPMRSLEARGFNRQPLECGDLKHDLYSKGAGPSVVVLHELPGLAQPAVDFSERLIDAGFRVHLPHLFGPLLCYAPSTNLVRLCISAEFARLRAGVEAPITRWMYSMISTISEQEGGGAVGVIGMCVTGAFIIPLVLHPSVKAAVASQPAIPLHFPYIMFGCGRGPWMRQFNVPDGQVERAGERVREESIKILALRYRDDRICPRERIDRLRDTFAANLEAHEYPCASWVRRVFKPPHAVLTDEYDRTQDPSDPTRDALQRVVDFLSQHLHRL